MSSTTGLKIGIVGAGVAGLAAAIALRKIGHAVEIFERSHFKNENGAAVSITPNGGRVLEHWGFDSVKAGGTENIQVRRPKGDTLEPMAPTLNFDDIEAKFGNKWFFYHRVDMHKQLRDLAEAGGAVLRLGNQVMDVEIETGVIELKDGSKIRKDLVVVADGQHDRINAKVTGREIPMQRSGQTAYRCLIPMKDILEDDETKALFEGQAPGFWAPALPAKGVMAVTYPCRDNTILNVLAVSRKLGDHESGAEDAVIDDWNFPATHEDLEKVLDGFHPTVKKMFLKSPEVKVYTQMKRQPLNKMTKGKALLIGDACHPMLLTHAQGVSSSLEDAAALELFLADLPPSPSVDSHPSRALLRRLQQYETFRLGRVSATQILTEPIIPGPKAAEMGKKQEQEIRKYYTGPLPATGSMPHSPAICQYFFAYDVRKEAVAFLDEGLDFMQGSPPASPLTTVSSIPPLAPLVTATKTRSAESPTASDSNAKAMLVYEEAQKALSAAQTALVQVQQTLVTAQNALDLATQSLKSSPPARSQSSAKSRSPAQERPRAPSRQKSTTPIPPTIAEDHAAPTPPEKPRRLKSFDSIKARMSGVGKKVSRGVSVREKEVPSGSSPERPAEEIKAAPTTIKT